jgi:signal transduction histidine kinase
MSFRLKIVLWFSAALLVTLIATLFAIVQIVRLMVYDELDSSLQAELAWSKEILVTSKIRSLSDADILHTFQERSSLNPRKEFITIRDAGGNVYFNSRNLEEQSLPNADRLTQPVTIEAFRGQSIRLIGVTQDGYSVAIGYSMADVESAVSNIISSSWIIFPVALVFAFTGGLLLVGHLLRPIKKVNRFLEAAATHPLSRELPELDLTQNDEIGELASRVTQAIGRMRSSMRWTLSYSSMVPHQLRTPVAVIRSQLEHAMQQDTARTELQKTVASTYDEVLKLNDIIETLLTLGKLQAGTLRLQLQKLRMRNFLEGFREEACGLVRQKNIEFILEEGPDILLTADMHWIRQALLNLLDNAIRHTPRGGSIRTRYAVTGSTVDLQLLDSGDGIPLAEIPYLFEPFYQGELRDRNAPGAGLGLVLVKMIVTAHGGTVHVASLPGNGTAFTMTLPLKQGASQSEADGVNS